MENWTPRHPHSLNILRYWHDNGFGELICCLDVPDEVILAFHGEDLH